VEDLLGEYQFEVAGLPPDLRVLRVQRNGMTLGNDRIRVAGGEQVTDVEIVVGRTP